MNYAVIAIALGFAAVHLFAGKLRFLDATPRSAYLSAAGGVAVAYVFLHLLPELFSHRETFTEHLGLGRDNAETVLLSLALVGLVAFYGVERVMLLHGTDRNARQKGQRGQRGQNEQQGEKRDPDGLFWLHVGSFAVYNLLIGFLLHEQGETDLRDLALFGSAMAVHFATNDHGMRSHHRHLYDAYGRWVLSLAVLAGALLGFIVKIGPEAIAMLFALLAGGVVLNVLKEELPEERESRFWPFALAAALYAAVLAAI